MPINFDNYKNIKDKFNSLYIFVAYNTNNEELLEKTKKISKNVDIITDIKKKNYLKNRISEFETYITQTENNQINKIYFVGNEINFELLDKEAINNLKFFDHQKISFVYSNTFDIDWLNNLLYNKDYYNVFHIQNNYVKYFILDETKKKIIYSSSKNTDIKKTIYDNILKIENKIPKYLIYGILKGYQDNLCINIINKELTDDEIINYFKIDMYKKNNDEVKELLGKLTVPKFIDKIVFGTDILEQLELSMIEKLYILDNHNDLEKIKMYNIEIKLVRSFEKGDIIDNFKNNYKGILGIKYY